jgi:hypothetical protein
MSVEDKAEILSLILGLSVLIMGILMMVSILVIL